MDSEKSQQSAEIALRIDRNGVLTVPAETLARLKARAGSTVHVRLTVDVVSKSLAKRTVTEEEIESIGRLQLEPRENVIKFLVAEGMLAGNRGFRDRAHRLLR
ncbi:MAG: hypothetical protein WBD36_03475 [Bacteroidota bacterium]